MSLSQGLVAFVWFRPGRCSRLHLTVVGQRTVYRQSVRQTDRQTSVYLYTSLTHKYIMHLYRVYELSSYKVYFKCSDTITRYVMKQSLISTCDCHICMCTINLTHSGDESAGVASLSLSGKSSCMLRVSMTPVKKSPHRRTGGGTWSLYNLSSVSSIRRGVAGRAESGSYVKWTKQISRSRSAILWLVCCY